MVSKLPGNQFTSVFLNRSYCYLCIKNILGPYFRVGGVGLYSGGGGEGGGEGGGREEGEGGEAKLPGKIEKYHRKLMLSSTGSIWKTKCLIIQRRRNELT